MRFLLAVLLIVTVQAETGFIVSSQRPSLDRLKVYPTVWASILKWTKPSTTYTRSDSKSEMKFVYPESVLAYRYWLVEEKADSPVSFRINLPIDSRSLAGEDEGFNKLDKNKWPYQLLEINGQNYRAYRLKNELHGRFTLNISLK